MEAFVVRFTVAKAMLLALAEINQMELNGQ
jgi:hypothetical protein